MKQELIQQDFNTMLDIGEKTVLQFTIPYFINTFEWYDDNDYKSLCSMIKQKIKEIEALQTLDIHTGIQIAVLYNMLDYVKQTYIPKPISKVKINNKQIITLLKNLKKQLEKQQTQIDGMLFMLEGECDKCK